MGEADANATYVEQDVCAWNMQGDASVHLNADREHVVLFPSPSGKHCSLALQSSG